jgi:hypothetical protein
MSNVFISYVRVDMDRALELEQALIAHGVDVWRDQHSIYGGRQWPKEIGEAVADCDAMLLLWSADSAPSHFVEFEWTTALALKKTIIPCLLDDTKLPPELAAINSIDCSNTNEAAPMILAVLPDEPQSRGGERRSQVIAQLHRLTAADPAEALAQAKALFKQIEINIGTSQIEVDGHGNVVTISNITRTLAALAVVAIIAVAALYFYRPNPRPSQPAPSPTLEETTKLTGQVDDSDGNPIAGAAVKVDEITGHPSMQTTTASGGGFIIDKIPARIGDRVRVYVSKDGYVTAEGEATRDQYVALPGPLPTVKLRRKK